MSVTHLGQELLAFQENVNIVVSTLDPNHSELITQVIEERGLFKNPIVWVSVTDEVMPIALSTTEAAITQLYIGPWYLRYNSSAECYAHDTLQAIGLASRQVS